MVVLSIPKSGLRSVGRGKPKVYSATEHGAPPKDIVCNKCGIKGHYANQCSRCMRCGEAGHVRQTCPHWNKNIRCWKCDSTRHYQSLCSKRDCIFTGKSTQTDHPQRQQQSSPQHQKQQQSQRSTSESDGAHPRLVVESPVALDEIKEEIDSVIKKVRFIKKIQQRNGLFRMKSQI